MRHKIGKSIKQALTESGYSDIELSNKLGLTRTSVYLWRKKDNAVIRKSNLIPLAKILNKKISYEGALVEFSDIKILDSKDEILNSAPNHSLNISGSAAISTQKLILQKDKYIALLEKTLQKAENRIKEQVESIGKLDRTISNLSVKKNLTLSLDHNRCQFIVNTEKFTYVDSTQLYADIYSINAFDIINDYKWKDLVCSEDMWRMPIIQAHDLDTSDNNVKTTWKVCGNGVNDPSGCNTYYETSALVLDDKGIFKKIDVVKSTKLNWDASNEYYKSFQSGE